MSQNDSESDVTGGGMIFRKNKNTPSNMQKARELPHWDTFEIVVPTLLSFPGSRSSNTRLFLFF